MVRVEALYKAPHSPGYDRWKSVTDKVAGRSPDLHSLVFDMPRVQYLHSWLYEDESEARAMLDRMAKALEVIGDANADTPALVTGKPDPRKRRA